MDAIRDHLVKALEWEDAHVGFDEAVSGMPPEQQGARPAGFDHSAWQLVEHIRIAQADILDFCVNRAYAHTMSWPDDYWPRDPQPPDPDAWNASLASYARDRDALKRLVGEVADLTAPVPTGKPSQTYLREVLLVIDHSAYHVGQVIDLRRALGLWK
jgi:hypothetical protein